MMAAAKEWLTAVVTVTLLLSVVQTLMPEGTLRKIAGFTGGLLLLAVLLRPATEIDLSGLDTGMEDWARAIGERQAEFTDAQEEALSSGIAERTASYISDKAEELGLEIQVRIETETGGDGVPVPVRAEIEGARSEELSSYMAETLGIPRERQVWHGQEEN